MKSLSDILIKVLDDTILEVKKKLEQKNKNCTGNTSESLEIRLTGKSLEIVQNMDNVAPIAVLEDGRDPGKVPYNFTSILEKWSIDKGIIFKDERERHSFAYLLNKRIQREGIKGDPEKWLTNILNEAGEKIFDAYYKYVLDMLNF